MVQRYIEIIFPESDILVEYPIICNIPTFISNVNINVILLFYFCQLDNPI